MIIEQHRVRVVRRRLRRDLLEDGDAVVGERPHRHPGAVDDDDVRLEGRVADQLVVARRKSPCAARLRPAPSRRLRCPTPTTPVSIPLTSIPSVRSMKTGRPSRSQPCHPARQPRRHRAPRRCTVSLRPVRGPQQTRAASQRPSRGATRSTPNRLDRHLLAPLFAAQVAHDVPSFISGSLAPSSFASSRSTDASAAASAEPGRERTAFGATAPARRPARSTQAAAAAATAWRRARRAPPARAMRRPAPSRLSVAAGLPTTERDDRGERRGESARRRSGSATI